MFPTPTPVSGCSKNNSNPFFHSRGRDATERDEDAELISPLDLFINTVPDKSIPMRTKNTATNLDFVINQEINMRTTAKAIVPPRYHVDIKEDISEATQTQ